MRIAVDAMGGDLGPGVVVEGVLDLFRDRGSNGASDLEVQLVGDEVALRRELEERDGLSFPIQLIHADQAVSMSEGATEALRRKPDSSIAVALALQKEGQSQAFVSTGNTGAVVAKALHSLGRLQSVRRPAIATYVPTAANGCVMLDVGANPTVKPQHLLEFGEMGSVYARHILGRPTPRVGLLNIGEEETKGSEVVQEAYQLLKGSSLNFVGNVEGRAIFRGEVDVVVCDGFVGNILLKFMESALGFIVSTVQKNVASAGGSEGGELLKPALKGLARSLSYEEYGGAPLLGVNGVCIICHGSSSSKAIRSAIWTAHEFVRNGLNDEINRQIASDASTLR